MEKPQVRHSLRAYLIAAVIPLAGIPLLALAFLTQVLVERAIEKEISRRASPELAAVSRNLELVERRIGRQIADLARADDFKWALGTRNSDALRAQTMRWFSGAQLELVRAYDARGALVAEFRHPNPAQALEAWSHLFASRKPASDDGRQPSSEEGSVIQLVTDREPSGAPMPKAASFFAPSARFEDDAGRRLGPEFLRFLRHEDLWVVRQTSGRPTLPQYASYKPVVDSDGKPIGYLEGVLSLDDAKASLLAHAQGIDLVFASTDLRVFAASHPEVTQKTAAALTRLGDTEGASTPLRTRSFEVKRAEQPVEFFFSEWRNEGGEALAWFGAGLSKADQVVFRRQILLWVGGLAAAMLALVTWLTILLANRLTKPLAELVRAVEAMRDGEWVQPVEAESRNEMGYLVRRFNEMALSVQVTKRTLETKLGELAEAHDALQQTQDQLVQSAKMSSLGQLVAGVAHELNNPIAYIYSNMSQMRLYLKNLERLGALMDGMKAELRPESREKVERELEEIEWDYVRRDMGDIVRSCTEGSVRVKDIVLGLRNFSRLDHGQISPADLHAALRDTVKLLSSQFKNRVEIEWDLRGDGQVQCNVSQINQVFMNLVANALQAIEGKGSVRISSWNDPDSPSLVVSVRDTGKGIPSEHLGKIFDPFFTTKKVGEGTGLGLSIVYGIVERHQGSIQVKSVQAPAAGHGTEFIVKLPRRGPRTRGQDHAA